MKIFARMRGGLGNQMFIYSYAYLLSKEYSAESIILDTKEYVNYYWPINIIDFNLSNYDISNEDLIYEKAIKKYHIFQKLYSITHKSRPNYLSRHFLKKHFLFCGTYCEMYKARDEKDLYLYGYFQNAELLENIRQELCVIFTPKNISNNAKRILNNVKEDAIAISVRVLTDEKNIKMSKENYINDKKYYLESLNILRAKEKKSQIIILSNNIEKIKKEKWFDSYSDKIMYVENCSGPEQIEIMKYCKFFIISNSSFSWWGAFLGTYLNKGKAIGPRKWYRKDDISITKLQFPELEVLER